MHFKGIVGSTAHNSGLIQRAESNLRAVIARNASLGLIIAYSKSGNLKYHFRTAWARIKYMKLMYIIYTTAVRSCLYLT